MFKKIHIPSYFLLIKKGNFTILLRENYKNFIDITNENDLKNLIESKEATKYYYEGRRAYPSILLKNNQRVVVRKYYHGGILGSLLRDVYLLGSRSFEEMILTEESRASGIPTTTPICAIHQSIFFFFYKAYLISLEIPDSQDLKTFLIGIRNNFILKRKIIRSVGKLVKKFHDNGFFHRDLQLKNILVSDEQTFIIDFDRAYRKPILSTNEKIKNLLRLKRSVEKWKRLGLPVTRTDQMRFLLSYTEGDIIIRNSIKKALSFYRFLYPLHRMGWFIKKLI